MTTPDVITEKLLTVKEAAALLCLSERRLRAHLSSGRLVGTKVCVGTQQRWLISPEVIAAFREGSSFLSPQLKEENISIAGSDPCKTIQMTEQLRQTFEETKEAQQTDLSSLRSDLLEVRVNEELLIETVTMAASTALEIRKLRKEMDDIFTRILILQDEIGVLKQEHSFQHRGERRISRKTIRGPHRWFNDWMNGTSA